MKHVLYAYSSPHPKVPAVKIKEDIVRKIDSYKETIIDKGFPFIIGIDLTLDTMKDPEDYWLFFHSGSCENIDTNIVSTYLGEFYIDNRLNGLTGILIQYCDTIYWLKNPRNKFSIDFENAKTTPK